MKVYKGSILSVNQNNDVFSYLVEDKGRIIYVGEAFRPERGSFALPILKGIFSANKA